jgi:hypothetical protein
VLTPISAIFALLLLPATLPNGIRLIELPSTADRVEIIVGYDEPGLNDLVSTTASRTLIFSTYAAGGEIELINQQDRTALRLVLPRWALPMLTDQQLSDLFKDVPKSANASGRALDPAHADFRSRVEEEIRSALLPSQSESQGYSTDDAFIAMSVPISETLRDALAGIPRRSPSIRPDGQISRLPAERTLRFRSELPAGAVIFAAPVPNVYYQEWYTILLLDRIVHDSLPIPLKTSLQLSLRPYYYRMELSLASGQFPEPAEDNFLQELQRLQFTGVDSAHLLAAKKQASEYLNSREIREWFSSRGISDRLQEGMGWMQSMTADDVRAAVRDLLLANRVIATWPPLPEQTKLEVENLSQGKGDARPSPGAPSTEASPDRARASRAPEPLPGGEAAMTPFPSHKDSPQDAPVPERLASGVSVVASNINGVFVSGGALTKYDHEADSDTVKAFQKYGAERILVLTPQSSLAHQRELWSAFRGSDSREAGVPKGPVSSGDLPAVYVLKTMLDLRMIQAGWWNDVELRIDATEGSTLQIRGDKEKRQRILEWIKDIATHVPPDKDFAWMREVAIHRFANFLPDIQALTWERDRQGTIQDIQTIVSRFVQDVAHVYF